MKKTLNAESVANELTGQSAFFRKTTDIPSQEDAPTPLSPTQEQPEVGPISETTSRTDESVRSVRPERDERDDLPVRPELPVRPVRRETKRHAFDIYRDQLESLKGMKMDWMMTGFAKSMSEMVREALDAYIEKNK